MREAVRRVRASGDNAIASVSRECGITVFELQEHVYYSYDPSDDLFYLDMPAETGANSNAAGGDSASHADSGAVKEGDEAVAESELVTDGESAIANAVADGDFADDDFAPEGDASPTSPDDDGEVATVADSGKSTARAKVS